MSAPTPFPAPVPVPNRGPNRGPIILAIGIASCALVPFTAGLLSLPAGIVAWAMGRNERAAIAAGTADSAGRGLVTAGYVCGMIGAGLSTVVLSSCLCVGCVRFGFGAALAASWRDDGDLLKELEKRAKQIEQERQGVGGPR